MNAISRAVSRILGKSGVPETSAGGGPVPAWWPANWWQLGYSRAHRDGNAAVEACISAISQTAASMALDHWREDGKGGAVRVTNSSAARVLRKPNAYQTRADFILNLIRSELVEGNGYGLCLRDERADITSIHNANPRGVMPNVVEDTGDIFYAVPRPINQPVNASWPDYWPARDVLHIRMQTPRHPLIGESPILAAAASVEAGTAIANHSAGFFGNMSRPSGYLKAPGSLKAEQVDALRDEWTKSFQGRMAGRAAVLQGGLEWVPLTMSAVDAAIVQSYKMSVADVARVYRVPLPVIGETGGMTFSNTETLMKSWLAIGLGFTLEHIELAFDALFELPPNEWISFDRDYLLRADFAARVDALTKGIVGGLFSPDEARAREGLPPAVGGDEPRVQQQVVPLSFAGRQMRLQEEAAEEAKKPDPPLALPPPSDDNTDDGDEQDKPEEDEEDKGLPPSEWLSRYKELVP